MPTGVYERSPELKAEMVKRVQTPEARRKKAASMTGLTAERSVAWKGDRVGYSGVHMWIREQFGRAAEHLCAECLEPAKQWANVSGEYHRDLDDFVPMCVPHHKLYDR